ncbi:DUF4386 family protein [Streptomyces sp. NBC_01615]|uniref:DUF4386 family protein n=1 Tax=Streptomyces sp. NBC_01615 TaxID=2975898 RepID=UPI00386D7CA0
MTAHTATSERPTYTLPSPRLRPFATVALVAVVVGQVMNFLLTWLAPGGDPSNGNSYDKVADNRGSFWALYAYGGVGIAVFTVGLAIAVCVLVRERGAVLARIGAVVAVLSGAFLAAGLAAIAVVYSYATDTAALDETAGRSFVHYVNDHDGRVMALIGPGALATILATLLITVALLRSRVVPWWISALFFVGGPLGFVFASGTSGAVAALPGAVAAILIAGQAWRQTAA